MYKTTKIQNNTKHIKLEDKTRQKVP